MRSLALFPVVRHAVNHGVGYNQQTHCFKLASEVAYFVDHHPALGVHVGGMGEDVEASVCEQYAIVDDAFFNDRQTVMGSSCSNNDRINSDFS